LADGEIILEISSRDFFCISSSAAFLMSSCSRSENSFSLQQIIIISNSNGFKPNLESHKEANCPYRFNSMNSIKPPKSATLTIQVSIGFHCILSTVSSNDRLIINQLWFPFFWNIKIKHIQCSAINTAVNQHLNSTYKSTILLYSA